MAFEFDAIRMWRLLRKDIPSELTKEKHRMVNIQRWGTPCALFQYDLSTDNCDMFGLFRNQALVYCLDLPLLSLEKLTPVVGFQNRLLQRPSRSEFQFDHDLRSFDLGAPLRAWSNIVGVSNRITRQNCCSLSANEYFATI